MFDYFYEWIQNIAFYLVLVTAVLNAVPNKDYRKYIRFFTGLVLVLMLVTPVLKVFGTDLRLEELYREVPDADWMQEFEGGLEIPEEPEETGRQEKGNGDIEVEEIRID